MYLELYGLKKTPFNITSDPRFFFESLSHKEALATLFYGIQEKKGIILITGEVGTGKTTLCRTFLNRLSLKTKTSLILNPYFSEVQLLQAIIEDFGLKAKGKNRLYIINALNLFLVEASTRGENAVVVIDEAQNLSSRQLEQIRLLSNLETATDKLLQIVLVGQPELKDKLQKPNLRQISQRIFVKHHLLPLTLAEVENYVKFRIEKAEAKHVKIDPESFKVIYEFSKGIPRLINMLCDRALLLGFVKEQIILKPDMFYSCIEELQ